MLRCEELQFSAVPPPAIAAAAAKLYMSDICQTFVGGPTSVRCQTSVHRLLSDVRLPSDVKLLSTDFCRTLDFCPMSDFHPQTSVARSSVGLLSVGPASCCRAVVPSCTLSSYCLAVLRRVSCCPAFSSNICLTFVRSLCVTSHS